MKTKFWNSRSTIKSLQENNEVLIARINGMQFWYASEEEITRNIAMRVSDRKPNNQHSINPNFIYI